ncbi:protein FosB isoform X2 [Eretmochelys imbricata]
MYQGFPGDYDSTSRCSSSPSAESQYLSSVDSFGSPTGAAASQECSGLGEMPGSFVPTVTAITTSQDLQWLVQPTLISSMAQSQPQGQQMSHQQPPPPAVDPYDLPGTSYSTPGMGAYSAGPSTAEAAAPSSRSARARPRRTREETETDQLEEEKAGLESEIAELQKEKERLEFVLVAHKPGCKIPYEDMPELGGQPGPSAEVSSLGMPVKDDPFGPAAYPSVPLQYQQSLGVPAPGAPGPAEVAFSSSYFTHGEPLSDPYPVNPSYTSSFVFTYPEGSTCGASHQRNSSSDQSSDSLNSPSLLAL